MIIICYLRIRIPESILILTIKTEKKGEEKMVFIVNNMAKKQQPTEE